AAPRGAPGLPALRPRPCRRGTQPQPVFAAAPPAHARHPGRAGRPPGHGPHHPQPQPAPAAARRPGRRCAWRGSAPARAGAHRRRARAHRQRASAVAACAAADRCPAWRRRRQPAAGWAGCAGERAGTGAPGMNAARNSSTTGLVIAAALILMLTMAARQTTGLFVAPIHPHTGVGIATISLALAIGQFTWGAVQPVFGALADRHGPEPVLVGGGLLLAAGLALVPFLPSGPGLMLSLGLMTAAGAGAGSFSILIGATAGRLPPERRSSAAGLINAGGSLGRCVFAPVLQLVIGAAGWTVAMLGMAATSLLTLPLARLFRRREGEAPPAHEGFEDRGLRHQLGVAARDRSYWLLH